MMVRGIYDFLFLPQSMQYTHTWEHGIFLVSRVGDGVAFNLYSCGNFFVEIKYAQPDNRIEGIRAFKNSSQLEPYLESIPDLRRLL